MVGKRFAATPEIKAKVQVLKAMSPPLPGSKEGKHEQAKALLEPLLANPDDLPESVRVDLAKTCFIAGGNGELSLNLDEYHRRYPDA